MAMWLFDFQQFKGKDSKSIPKNTQKCLFGCKAGFAAYFWRESVGILMKWMNETYVKLWIIEFLHEKTYLLKNWNFFMISSNLSWCFSIFGHKNIKINAILQRNQSVFAVPYKKKSKLQLAVRMSELTSKSDWNYFQIEEHKKKILWL